MTRSFPIAAVVALAAALLLPACGDDAPGGGNNNQNVPADAWVGPDGGCTLALTAPDGTAVVLATGGHTDLTVLYQCDQTAMTSTLIGFAIQGNGGGAALSAAQAATNFSGVATVTLTAGNTDASFQVVATPPSGAAVNFVVTVSSNPMGSITVNMSYAGQQTLNSFQAFLYQVFDCTTFDPFSPTQALQASAVVQVVSEPIQFQTVPVGTGYAVTVLARNGSELLASGCASGATVNGGQNTVVPVQINDIPIQFDGTYDLDNHLDLTGALPPTVGLIINLFDEMSDDHSHDGTQDGEYGVDPAAFLMDFVYRQFCKWECTNANPDWDNCTPGTHPYGDLEKLYTENFQMWDGAQPRISGVCGGLEFGNEYVQDQVQSLITSYVPDVVLTIMDIAGDIARAINNMHVTSVLTLDNIGDGKMGPFTHTLRTMIVEMHDFDGNWINPPWEFDLAAVGLSTISYTGNTVADGNVLEIPEHSFQIEFGKLVQYIYLNGLLPALGYTSTAEMFGDWIDCHDVGVWLEDQVGYFTVADYEGFCTQGITLAGDYIDGAMDDWIDVTTEFTLQGTAEAGTLNERRVVQTLVNGVWDGSWTEGGSSATFPGTFTGERRP